LPVGSRVVSRYLLLVCLLPSDLSLTGRGRGRRQAAEEVKAAIRDHHRTLQKSPLIVQSRIVSNPEIVGGAPTIRGTRVPVRAVACVWRATGDRGLIVRNYPHLSADDVDAAPRFYADHRPEIDAELLAEEQGPEPAE
jgi:uncharacterized protein (DUF433 family)